MDVEPAYAEEPYDDQPLSRADQPTLTAARRRCEYIAAQEFPADASTFTEVTMWDDGDFAIEVVHTVHAAPDGGGRWLEVAYKRSNGTIVYRDYEDEGGERTYLERRTVEAYGTPYAEQTEDES